MITTKISVLGNLRTLHMKGIHLTEKNAPYLKAFQNLTELSVTSHSKFLAEDGIEHLSELKNLARLNLMSFYSQEKATQPYQFLKSLKNLYSLRLMIREPKSEDLSCLTDLPNLKCLTLRAHKPLSTECIKVLSCLPLTTLEIYYSDPSSNEEIMQEIRNVKLLPFPMLFTRTTGKLAPPEKKKEPQPEEELNELATEDAQSEEDENSIEERFRKLKEEYEEELEDSNVEQKD